MRGFTILEVLVAMVLIATVATGVAGLMGTSVQMGDAARAQSAATLLATQKMEQLLALTWRFGPGGTGLPESDTSTDLSYDPPQSGGTGLDVSPATTLDVSTTGYADYLDGSGRWVGRGAIAPLRALYVRRWRVQALPFDPSDSRVIQVLVRPLSGASSSRTADVVLTAFRTRKIS